MNKTVFINKTCNSMFLVNFYFWVFLSLHYFASKIHFYNLDKRVSLIEIFLCKQKYRYTYIKTYLDSEEHIIIKIFLKMLDCCQWFFKSTTNTELKSDIKCKCNQFHDVLHFQKLRIASISRIWPYLIKYSKHKICIYNLYSMYCIH